MTAITTELITKAFIFKFVEVDNYASAYRIAVQLILCFKKCVHETVVRERDTSIFLTVMLVRA